MFSLFPMLRRLKVLTCHLVQSPVSGAWDFWGIRKGCRFGREFFSWSNAIKVSNSENNYWGWRGPVFWVSDINKSMNSCTLTVTTLWFCSHVWNCQVLKYREGFQSETEKHVFFWWHEATNYGRMCGGDTVSFISAESPWHTLPSSG